MKHLFYKLQFICMPIILNIFVSHAQIPFIAHPAPAGLNINGARMNDLKTDASNTKWMCFATNGLGAYDGTNWNLFDVSNSGIPSDSVTCIDFDINGNQWIGTQLGAAYKSGNNWTTYNTTNSGLPTNTITAILVDGNTIWFGTHSGVVTFDGSNWNAYHTGNSGIVYDSITCFSKDNSGNIWVGTRNGLSKYNGTWLNYTTSNSVIGRYVVDIECDLMNRVWISAGTLFNNAYITNCSVYYTSNNQLLSFTDDFYHYEKTLSFPNSLCLTKDINGKVVFRVIVNSNSNLIFRINQNTFEHFEYYGLNNGAAQNGSIFEFDNTNILWTIPRFRFYFYSLDMSAYITTLGGINFKNHRSLDLNDVAAGINVSGDMHWDYTNPKYEVPKGSGKQSVFSSALWIGGLDQGGELHMSGQTYRQTGFDFWPGPIDGLNTPFDSSTCIAFDQIWKIDKWKIEEFKNNFLAGNVTNGTYLVPDEIATWPANGNGLVTSDMAPYFDANNDGVYNPLNGDYPLIKGDQMLYHVFNDSLGIHTATGGKKLGVEVHSSSYVYYCQGIPDSNMVMNRTTLYNYKIINRSSNDYNNIFLGLWCDSDLGNATDDVVGCDTLLHAGFTYNGDNDDETISGYGLNPPMQNVQVLRGMLADANDGIDNNLNGIIDEPGERTTMNHFQTYNNVNGTPAGNPSSALHYYNYMQSIWADSSHVTYGGSGYMSSSIPTNFMYSGIPYSGIGWTEISASQPPFDRRMLLSSGPVSFASGDTITLDFAYVFTWDQSAPNGLNTSIARNIADLQRIRYWFDNNNFPSCEIYVTGGPDGVSLLEQITVYPNPATTSLNFRSAIINVNGIKYTVLDLLGNEVLKGRITSGSINIENLVEQIYILKLETENGSRVMRFIKI